MSTSVSLTRVVLPIGEVILCELHVDGRHLRGEVEGLLVAGDHRLGAGAPLVRCGHLAQTHTTLSY